MVRLWDHLRSRNKEGDKIHSPGAQEWFSRTTGEPSRQALTHMVKEHKRNKSESSGSRVSRASKRSQTSTAAANEWDSEQSKSAMALVIDPNSQLVTPVRTREPSIISAYEHPNSASRPESAARTLISKSSQILKRKRSKITLNSYGSSSMLGLNIPLGSSSTQGSSSPSTLTPSPLTPTDARRTISSPFAFQHVTHTDQAEFSSLSEIRESELVSRFSALTTQQAAGLELKGIQADDIPSTNIVDLSKLEHEDPSSSYRLPRTPPRPQPPPKNSPPKTLSSPIDLKQPVLPNRSSSIKTRSPESRLAAVSGIVDYQESCDKSAPSAGKLSPKSKPLPRLPEIIHAVSTTDDSARTMMTTPLPMLPGAAKSSPRSSPSQKRISKFHNRKTSSALRHMSTFPAPDQPWRHSTAENPIAEESEPIQRHKSDLALFEHARRNEAAMTNKRISVGLKAIDVSNWEDAIDDAWDLTNRDSKRITMIPAQLIFEPKSPQASHDTTQQQTMLQTVHPAASHIGPEANVLGLGIQRVSANFKDLPPPSFQADGLSTSSSQDSLILSLASSILGTQRSSKSSMHSENVRAGQQLESPQESTSAFLSVRPASPTCETQVRRRSARPESGCLPTMSKSPSVAPEEMPGNTSHVNNAVPLTPPVHTPADVLYEVPQVAIETSPKRCTVIELSEETSEDTVAPLSSTTLGISKHRHSSASQPLNVPERNSSIVRRQSRRKRASHLVALEDQSPRSSSRNSSRPSSRASYSLFPTAPISTPTPNRLSMRV